jgi:hypothetical protein
MAVVKFVTHLPKEQYRPGSGWVCSALSLPRSEVTRLLVGEEPLKSEEFLVQGVTIRLAEGMKVDDAEATISVRRVLTFRRSSALVAVGAVLIALAAFASTYQSKPTAGCAETR